MSSVFEGLGIVFASILTCAAIYGTIFLIAYIIDRFQQRAAWKKSVADQLASIRDRCMNIEDKIVDQSRDIRDLKAATVPFQKRARK